MRCTCAGLRLAGGSVAPPVAFLRRVPLLRALVPAPQQVPGDSLAIYSIQLHAYTCGFSGQSICYEAQLAAAP